jgi:hypothetical protein
MPKDTWSEDMISGTHEARKVPGAQSFNVYNRTNGVQDGILFALEGRWYSRFLDGPHPVGPFENAEDAFADAWGCS